MKAILCATTLAFSALAAHAEGPPAELATCAGCHGENGVATAAATPHLNDQLQTYLAETILRIQKGRLSSSVPNHIPAALNPDAVAAYYAGIKAQRPKQETDPAKVARGNNLYLSRCVECHADSGRIGGDEAPIMNAQNLEHLMSRGKAYTNGQRKFVEPLMRDAYKGLSEDDIEAIAHYLASLDQYPTEGKKKRRR